MPFGQHRWTQMIAKCVEKYIRMSPRKIRQPMDLIRGKNVNTAVSILSNLNKRASGFVLKALRSAINNAERKTEGKIGLENLYISKITADCGPTLKRFKAASMGRAVMIRRRSSHITVELDLRQPQRQIVPVKKVVRKRKK